MATINGTSGDDTLNGTNSADLIFGFAGNDILTHGATQLDGDTGADTRTGTGMTSIVDDMATA